MTDRLFDVLETKLITERQRWLMSNFVAIVGPAVKSLNVATYDEPFGYTDLDNAEKALYFAAEKAAYTAAKNHVFRKLAEAMMEQTK